MCEQLADFVENVVTVKSKFDPTVLVAVLVWGHIILAIKIILDVANIFIRYRISETWTLWEFKRFASELLTKFAFFSPGVSGSFQLYYNALEYNLKRLSGTSLKRAKCRVCLAVSLHCFDSPPPQRWIAKIDHFFLIHFRLYRMNRSVLLYLPTV